jgi:hypothetical protein
LAYVSVPNDLSKVKTKVALNLTKRQLICFGAAAVIGVPTYLFTRSSIGGTAAMILMIVLMLPCFFLAMYERDGLPFEKVLRNVARAKFLWPQTRPYQTHNFYAYLSNPRKEVQHIGKNKKARPPKRTADHSV